MRLEPIAPKVAGLLTEAEDDLVAFYAMPAEHWSKLRSTNPLERVNREIGRRSDVVGIFPNDAALLRLAASLLIEQNDDWLVGRRYLSEGSMALVLGRGAERASHRAERRSRPRSPGEPPRTRSAAPTAAPSPAARSPPGRGGAPPQGASPCSVISPTGRSYTTLLWAISTVAECRHYRCHLVPIKGTGQRQTTADRRARQISREPE